ETETPRPQPALPETAAPETVTPEAVALETAALETAALETAAEAPPAPAGRGRRATWATGAALLMVTVVMLLTGRLDSLARDLIRFFEAAPVPPAAAPAAEAEAAPASALYAFKDLDIHP